MPQQLFSGRTLRGIRQGRLGLVLLEPEADEPVAEALGNTVAMSQKSYVHPRLIDAVREAPRDALEGLKRPPGRRWLSSAEVGLIAYLKSKPKRRTTAKA